MADLPPVLPDSPAPGAGESAHKGQDQALREVLHQAADRVADYLSGLGSQAIFPTQAEAPKGDLFPQHGEDLGDLFDDSADWAIANSVHVGHPGYVGHMDSGVAVAGILGDFLASALNQNLLAYELAPGATLLEKKLVALFGAEAGFDPGCGGLFTTGGTGANLTALLLARDAASRQASRHGLAQENRLCVFASADAHYSLAKASAVIGLGSEQVIPVPVTGPERRMDAALLPELMHDAVARGLRPMAAVKKSKFGCRAWRIARAVAKLVCTPTSSAIAVMPCTIFLKTSARSKVMAIYYANPTLHNFMSASVPALKARLGPISRGVGQTGTSLPMSCSTRASIT